MRLRPLVFPLLMICACNDAAVELATPGVGPISLASPAEACGNGRLDPAERCDTALSPGADGACPVSCEQERCMHSVVQGAACEQRCETFPVGCMDFDGCCPPGCDSTLDNDCPASCGNGVLETSEQCDTGIAAGNPGACPEQCDDGRRCTTDTLLGRGTCNARCTTTPVTACRPSDGCCPLACSSITDSDCPNVCGNSVVESGELCDRGIATGPGACPSTCADSNACTFDELRSPLTCLASCAFTAITSCASGDGCCPSGCNGANDADCSAVCGNGAVESGELCDTARPAGSSGACPSTCSDQNACTMDSLMNAGTCAARCVFAPQLQCVHGDGCCPNGCTGVTDDDCTLAYTETWVRPLAGDGGAEPVALTVDALDNTYVTGSYRNPLDFGGPATEPGGAYLASYDPAGNRRWARRVPTTQRAVGYAVAVDRVRGVVCHAGEDLLGGQAFIECHDLAGAPLWSKRLASSYVTIRAAAVDEAGNWYFTGSFFHSFDFGGGVLNAQPPGDGFLLSLSGSGAFRWVKPIASAGGSPLNLFDRGASLATVGTTVTLSGVCSGASTDFGGGPVSDGGISFTHCGASFDTDGGFRWGRRWGGQASSLNNLTSSTVLVDAYGRVTVAGTAQTAIDFGGGNVTIALGTSMFLAGLTHSGTHRWSKGFFHPCGVYCFSDSLSGASIDGLGNIAFTGSTDGPLTFGGPSSVGGPLRVTRPVLVGLKSDGAFRFAQTLSSNNVRTTGVASASGGMLYVIGRSTPGDVLAGTTLPSPSPFFNNGFLLKLTP